MGRLQVEGAEEMIPNFHRFSSPQKQRESDKQWNLLDDNEQAFLILFAHHLKHSLAEGGGAAIELGKRKEIYISCSRCGSREKLGNLRIPFLRVQELIAKWATPSEIHIERWSRQLRKGESELH
jgi:hypothetical protein